VLRVAGVPAELSSALTYAVALLLCVSFYAGKLKQLRPSPVLLILALAAGCSNVGFVLASVYGEVMRVVLLFYLAPVWTVLFARVLLGEQLNMGGIGIVALALAGAFVMLWQPAAGMPVPQNGAEWMAMGAGVAFALANVLVRKADTHGIEEKSFWVLAGCTGIGMIAAGFSGDPVTWPPAFAQGALLPLALIILIGVVLLFANLVVQFGLSNTPANRAIVIYLFELVVAALASWLLAGESMSLKEWTGGAMIVGASLVSARLGLPHALPDTGKTKAASDSG
jgi:drug/metabolite transporter (DMT)-like permease